ncbi:MULTISPECIES: hypothetical protein [unclassified Rathayibacter]|uniref:hypothetical protein n=1 Tax=unclassified Rathayibacter TaxID=2609250 RepID=UPI001FB4C46C|nr:MULTISPECIES: hypothetical protein [unclassified Rathayibacter]MCJ1673352.1 hypothetical protein [Rathayibacter sp. VKM Ac-2929]MCJ1682899.1 hypothetical protein [Rathayibacter sp. VKM Ac-2928]
MDSTSPAASENAGDGDALLQALCTTSELDEDGEVVAVGDRIRRLAVPHRGGYIGGDLDETPWMLDRYGDATGAADTVWIEGLVTSVAAIRTRMTRRDDGVWTVLPGSAVLEPLRSTADTRRPVPEIDWGPHSEPDADGHAYAMGFARRSEGDEELSGWLFTVRRA